MKERDISGEERNTNQFGSLVEYRASDSFWDGREQIEEDDRVYEINSAEYPENRRNLLMKMIDAGRERSRCEN